MVIGVKTGFAILFVAACLVLYAQVFFHATSPDNASMLSSSGEKIQLTTKSTTLVIPDISISPLSSPLSPSTKVRTPSSGVLTPVAADPKAAQVPPASTPFDSTPMQPPTPTPTPIPPPLPPSEVPVLDPDSNEYEFGRPIISMDFPLPPPLDTSVVIFVMSARENFSRRQTIRQTWGTGHHNVYFILGAACPLTPLECAPYRCGRLTQEELNGGPLAPKAYFATDEEVRRYQAEQVLLDKQLLEEAKTHNDLLIFTSFPDSYRTLTHKLKASYVWGVANTSAKFFVKADDDQYVRVKTLERYITKTFNSASYQYIGSIKRNTKAHRVGLNGHIYNGNIEIKEYKPTHYPPWASGAFGHVVTRPIAQYMADNADRLVNYSGEDVSLAIWINESPFRDSVEYIDTRRFKTHGNCYEPADVIIGHKIPEEKIRVCYEKMDENESLVF